MFDGTSPPRLRIDIASDQARQLRRDSRQYVPAIVRDGEEVFQRVGIHLKGSTGSFRSIDDKPALTLDFSKFIPGQIFHGFRKIHLNNSVEDPSYFNEFIGAELFRAAGVPTPRVTHARVELNGRDLGLYVLKEGFDETFLKQHFRQTNGNLYDTGTGHDVNEALQRDRGDGPGDRSDLKALTLAAQEPDLPKRWQALEKALNVERFISFMVMEVMLGHRDGYCLAKNNFRIYHDPESHKMVFLPHGMDQLFGKPDAPLQPTMHGLVARALMETPEGRKRYRERFAFLLTNVLDVAAVRRRADDFLARVRPILKPGEAHELERALAGVKNRVAERRHSLEQQLQMPELKPLQFVNGIARLATWRPVDTPANGILEQTKSSDGRRALHIRAGPLTSASWRSNVLLTKGRYRFQGAVRTSSVEALNFGKNKGAGLRILGAGRSSPFQLVGDNDWKELEVQCDIGAEQEIELICELRARKGEVWFDLDSLRVLKIPYRLVK